MTLTGTQHAFPSGMKSTGRPWQRRLSAAIFGVAAWAFPTAASAQLRSQPVSIQISAHVLPGAQIAGYRVGAASPGSSGAGLGSTPVNVSANTAYRVELHRAGGQPALTLFQSDRPGLIPWGTVLERLDQAGLDPELPARTPITLDIIIEAGI